MKTKTITLYSFDELSEEAKEKAIERLADINVDHEWWSFVYEDAARMGIEITEFELDCVSIKGQFKRNVTGDEVAESIKFEYGEGTKIHNLAISFLSNRDSLVAQYSNGRVTEIVSEENNDKFDYDLLILEDTFLRDLLLAYHSILLDEYKFLTSRESIIGTIEANEYLFTENGKLESL